MVGEILFQKLTQREIAELAEKDAIILLPVGSVEQHGFHLPLDTDIFIPYEISQKVANKIRDLSVLVAPPISIGCSERYLAYLGTLTLSAETFKNSVKEVCRCFIKHGFRRIIIVNGHGGNRSSLTIALEELMSEVKAIIVLVNWWELVADRIRAVRETKIFHHADEMETSVAMALNQRVIETGITDFIPTPPTSFSNLDIVSPPPRVFVYAPFQAKGSGVVGVPSKACKEKGKKIVKVLIQRLCKLVYEIREMKLD